LSSDGPKDDSTESLSDVLSRRYRLNEICDRFEEAWQSGNPPDIARFLPEKDASEDLVKEILGELLLIDAQYREKNQEPWSVEFYREQHPSLFDSRHEKLLREEFRESGDNIESLLSSVTASERLFVKAELGKLAFHARGGLGEVYVAEDYSLNRQLAIKVIRDDVLDEDSRSRFFIEAEVTGRLDHPGIVPVYGIGQTDNGRDFLAMRFVKGKTLRAAIDRFHNTAHPSKAARRRELNLLLGHVIAACHTIAYAHSRGILHRDIKPDNIMIGRYHETLVVDWGLAVPIPRDDRARSSGEDTLHVTQKEISESGKQFAAGTIGYVSPESLPGSLLPLGPRADVYSLGGTLYHLLTGKRSVSGKPGASLINVIAQGSFPPPGKVCRGTPRPLEAICLKAMAADPQQRYQTATELADDLEAYVADEPLSISSDTLLDKIRRAARNHKTAAAILTVFLLTLATVGSLGSIILNQQAIREHSALLDAKQATTDGLRLAASFAARTVAAEIDVRWRVLEAIAADNQLRELLEKASEGESEEDWRALQSQLQGLLQPYEELLNDTRLIDNKNAVSLCDKTGRQVARFPKDYKTIGEDFSWRDYFHGPDAGEPYRPLTRPYISTSYISQSDSRLKISYSVPVWPAGPDEAAVTPVGIIALAVPAGDFQSLQKEGLGRDQLGVLIDNRLNEVVKDRQKISKDHDERQGLILHHPALRGLQVADKHAGRTVRPHYIQPELSTALTKLADLRFDTHSDEDLSPGISPENFRSDYEGALESDRGVSWIAAFEPVMISGRPEALRRTGLFVLVQQRQAAAE
jgi:serine/threonine protein kinase